MHTFTSPGTPRIVSFFTVSLDGDTWRIAPDVIIAKVTVEWPGKSLLKSMGNVYFGGACNTYNTPPPLVRDGHSNYTTYSTPSPVSNASPKRHPQFGQFPSPAYKLCEAHGWRMDHETENCYALRDLRRELAKQGRGNNAGRGRGAYQGKGRVNATDANAILVNDNNGGGSINRTVAGGDSNAFSFLAYNNLITLNGTTNATIGICHNLCTTARTSVNDATFMMHPDSGTNYHMSGNRSIFLELLDLPTKIPVSFGNGQNLLARQKGTVCLSKEVVLRDVLFVEGLTVNLISTTANPLDIQMDR